MSTLDSVAQVILGISVRSMQNSRFQVITFSKLPVLRIMCAYANFQLVFLVMESDCI
jgi:hypothetical protein